MPKVGKKSSVRFQPYGDELLVKDDENIRRFTRSGKAGRRNAATEDDIKAVITEITSIKAAHLHDDLSQLNCSDDATAGIKEKKPSDKEDEEEKTTGSPLPEQI